MTSSHPAASIASLPDGKEIAYFDSGPVTNSTSFTTLILLHGCHFNTYGFHHHLSLAFQVNLRLVLVQRRDYAGSSKYTDEEMAILSSDNPTPFFSEEGVMWANFVYYLIKNTDVRKLSEDGSSGGIAFGAWSLGSAFAQTLFFEKAAIDEEVYTIIEPYVSTLILYDPPHLAFGIPTLPPFNHLFYPFHIKDPEERKQKFRAWVTSYYDHKGELDAEELSGLDPRPETERGIFGTWSAAMQEEWTETFPLRSDGFIMSNSLVQSHINSVSSNALFGLNTRRFPRARISYVHAGRSVWMCTLARHETRRKYTELVKQGHKENLRTFKFIDLMEESHFIHSESPEVFMKTMADCIRWQ